jgi:hypothetical protein
VQLVAESRSRGVAAVLQCERVSKSLC